MRGYLRRASVMSCIRPCAFGSHLRTHDRDACGQRGARLALGRSYPRDQYTYHTRPVTIFLRPARHALRDMMVDIRTALARTASNLIASGSFGPHPSNTWRGHSRDTASEVVDRGTPSAARLQRNRHKPAARSNKRTPRYHDKITVFAVFTDTVN